MKTPPIIRKFRVPVYTSSFWLVLHPSISKAVEYIEDTIDRRIDRDPGVARALIYDYEDKGNRTHRIILFLKPNAGPGTIAHEVKHAINMLFAWHGVRLSAKNDEAECYYLELLIDKIHNFLKIHKKDFKPKSKEYTPSQTLSHL